MPWPLLLICQPLTLCCPGSGDPCTATQEDFQPYCSLPSNKQPSFDSLPQPFADIFPLAGLDLSLADYFSLIKAAEMQLWNKMHSQHQSCSFLVWNSGSLDGGPGPRRFLSCSQPLNGRAPARGASGAAEGSRVSLLPGRRRQTLVWFGGALKSRCPLHIGCLARGGVLHGFYFRPGQHRRCPASQTQTRRDRPGATFTGFSRVLSIKHKQASSFAGRFV